MISNARDISSKENIELKKEKPSRNAFGRKRRKKMIYSLFHYIYSVKCECHSANAGWCHKSFILRTTARQLGNSVRVFLLFPFRFPVQRTHSLPCPISIRTFYSNGFDDISFRWNIIYMAPALSSRYVCLFLYKYGMPPTRECCECHDLIYVLTEKDVSNYFLYTCKMALCLILESTWKEDK